MNFKYFMRHRMRGKIIVNDMANHFFDAEALLANTEVDSYLLYYISQNNLKNKGIVSVYEPVDFSEKIVLLPQVTKVGGNDHLYPYRWDKQNKLIQKDEKYNSLINNIRRFFNAFLRTEQTPKLIIIPVALMGHSILIAVKPDGNDPTKAVIMLFDSFGRNASYVKEASEIVDILRKEIYTSPKTKFLNKSVELQKDSSSCAVFMIEAIKELMRDDNLFLFDQKIQKVTQDELYKRRRGLGSYIRKENLSDDYYKEYRKECVIRYQEQLNDEYLQQILSNLELDEEVEKFLRSLTNCAKTQRIPPALYEKLIDFKNTILSTNIHGSNYSHALYAYFIRYLDRKTEEMTRNDDYPLKPKFKEFVEKESRKFKFISEGSSEKQKEIVIHSSVEEITEEETSDDRQLLEAKPPKRAVQQKSEKKSERKPERKSKAGNSSNLFSSKQRPRKEHHSFQANEKISQQSSWCCFFRCIFPFLSRQRPHVPLNSDVELNEFPKK